LKPIHGRPEALQELEAAASWYELRSPEAKQGFVDDFEKAAKLVRAYPKAWPGAFGLFRKCLFSRFPYQLIYLEGKEAILLLAVMHLRRRPGYWKKRAK
jgi:plasmid stabilization system protein ParE